MPYLQLDVPRRYPIEVKGPLAPRLGNIYADVRYLTQNQVVARLCWFESGQGHQSF